MSNLIKKILLEATYEKDNEQHEAAEEIIINLENAFFSYTNNDENFHYKENIDGLQFNKNDLLVIYKTGNLTIKLYDTRYPKTPKSGAHYKANSKTITLYGCKFEWNYEANKFKYFDFDKSSLYHELIHYFDYTNKNIENNNTNYDKVKIKDKNNFSRSEYKKYLNHGVEFNAHFIQNILPIVKEIYNYRKRNGVKTFNDFKKELFNYTNVPEFYSNLTSKLKKHFMKRIAEYFQKLKF